MKIPNINNLQLDQLLPLVQAKYPGAYIKKPFLTPNSIFVPKENFKFLVRDGKTTFKIDFIPPVLWTIGAILLSFVFASVVLSIIYGQLVIGIGGALWILLGLLVVKSIFKALHKEKFEGFRNELNAMVSNIG